MKEGQMEYKGFTIEEPKIVDGKYMQSFYRDSHDNALYSLNAIKGEKIQFIEQCKRSIDRIVEKREHEKETV